MANVACFSPIKARTLRGQPPLCPALEGATYCLPKLDTGDQRDQSLVSELRQRVALLEREKTLLHARLSSPAPPPSSLISAPSSSLQVTELQLKVAAQAGEIRRLEARVQRLSEMNAVQQASSVRRQNSIRILFSKYRAAHKMDAQFVAEQLAGLRREAEGAIRSLTQKLLGELEVGAALRTRIAELQQEVPLSSGSSATALTSTTTSSSHSSSSSSSSSSWLLTAQAEAMQALEAKNKQLAAQLTVQMDLLQLMRTAHEEEVASVAYAAHVKDLTRLAEQRETQLALDRISSEAQFSKEVHQIISFSCQAAENVLAETNAAIVTKLQEGRQRRMATVEKVVAASRRELDQRSRETVATGAQQLASFHAKASKRVEKSRRKRSDLWDRILSNTTVEIGKIESLEGAALLQH